MVNDKRLVYGFLFSSNTFSGVICETKTLSLKYGSERKFMLVDFSACNDKKMGSYMIMNKKGFAIADEETGFILFYDMTSELVVSKAKRIVSAMTEEEVTETISKYKSKIEDFNKNDILGIKLIREFNIIKPQKQESEQINLF